MDNSIFNHKLPPKAVGLTRSAINNNFALAPIGVSGFRYSSIDVNGSSGSSDISSISSNSSGCDIRTRNRNANHRHGVVSINDQTNNHHRWTVNSIDKSPNKNYDNKKGINLTSLATNDTRNYYSVGDKAKWTHKSPINGNISVNTSHSNGWPYQTKPFRDNTTNGSEVWLNDYYKEFYRNNTEQNRHEVNNRTKQLSGDHRIRITVNCDNEQNRHHRAISDRNRISSEENVSGASVTIVEINDSSQQSNDDTTTPPNIIRNSLNDTTTKYINSSNKSYNEKPIDVPEDFERQAYEFQRNELSPFVRNLQPNSQRHRKRFPPPKKPTNPSTPIENTNENMGNGCSKNIRRLNKNTVAPNHITSTPPPIITNFVESKKYHSTQNISTKTVHNESIPSTSTNQNCSSRPEIQTNTIGKTDTWNTQRSSNFDSEAFNLASCIDTQSIIFDKSETKATRQTFKRSISIDSSSDKSVQSVETKRFTAHLHRLFKSNQNLTSTTSATAASPKTENSISFPKLYQRFSGSLQSLFNGNLNNNRKRNLSASDTNLNRINRCTLTQQQLIDNDYCPSVLYNRKARTSCSEKNLDKTQTFSRWKNQLWLKISRKKANPSARKSIQAIDGGFFEKFGSLLSQRSETAEDEIVNSHALQAPGDKIVTDSVSLRTIEEGENDSGTETLHDTDSEPEDQQSKQEELIKEFSGLNTEELYEEILYQILHNVGCETENETCQSSLFGYIQDAFKITNARHDELLSAAAMKKPPEMRLNVEVVEAKELESKDPNGLSDPFVTMYIGSAPSHRYNTSVKSCTLNPSWEEHFSLPLINGTGDDSLVVEVWDFDPAETIGEKMTKILDIKGVRGFRKLMKEIAVTASTGKHDNELIGRCSIPLRTISTSGLVMWFSLDKKNKPKHQGLIKLRLSFSAEKNCKVAVQEHKHLLRVLLLHELESSKVAPYWWSGKFSEQGEAVIAQHTAQSGMNANTRSVAQWSAYTTIHANHALSFKLFENLLEKLLRFLHSPETNAEDTKLFWEGVKKLLPSCYSVIRNIRKKTSSDKNSMKVLTEVLSILSIIGTLSPPADVDLFPKNVYGWLSKANVDLKTLDIYSVVEEAIRSGAQDFLFVKINEIRDVNRENDEENLQNIIKITQLIRADLQRGLEFYDKLFKDRVQCDYTSICYIYYEKELSENFQMTIERACKHLKRISMPDHAGEPLPEHEEVNMGTTLFEVYLILKRFSALSTALCPETAVFRINDFHNWFTSGVAHWLDISLYKAMKRIEKAIELDKLMPIDDTVKYSTSPIDTLAIFHQIKIFWTQLNWPDVEGSYTFIAKIVDDICRCCVYYADTMSSRVEGLGNIEDVYDGNKFVVTQEWCLAINNIDYIRQKLPPFIEDLKVEDIIEKLAEYRSQAEAQRCEQTLKNVVENAVDTEENKIVDLIEIMARKMGPPMRKFLMEGAEVLHQDSNSMDRLMLYLEESLKTLNTELNEVNFERILSAIWVELAIILRDLVQTNLDKRRPPQFFMNLRESLRIMVKSFKCGEMVSDCRERETLTEIENLLQLHSYETSDLIHQYYIQRYKDQQAMDSAPLGQLTIRYGFSDDNCLEIEVVNARNLVPIASNGSCDPFVRIQFSPEEKFGVTTKYKTNFQNKTLFPLFDEKFVIPLNDEQRSNGDAILIFSVKDRDLLGFSNQYIAEGFVKFNEIANSNRSEQKHLKLNRPKNSDCPCLNALKLREGDKLAKEFMKKIKQKLPSS